MSEILEKCDIKYCSPEYHKKCVYARCETTNLHGGARGYCGAHYRQVSRGEVLHPARGSRAFWEDHLNDKGEKQCSRCEYWLDLNEFHERRDGSKVHQEYGRAHCRRCNILRRMGLTARDFDGMLAAQGGGCAICGATENSIKDRALAVDHDHSCCSKGSSCGKCVRGILCDSCNVMLARARDSQQVLWRAIGYLAGACPVR